MVEDYDKPGESANEKQFWDSLLAIQLDSEGLF